MAGPITPDKLGAHPALQKFVEYVERHTGEPVDLARIDVTTQREVIPGSPDNNVRNDGIVELSYSLHEKFSQGIPNPTFYAKLHGPAQVLFLRHGWVTAKNQNGYGLEADWALENLPTPIQGACAAIAALGGEAEAKAECQDSPKAAMVAGTALSALSWDAALTVFRTKLSRDVGKFPLHRLAVKNFTPNGVQRIGAGARLLQTIPPVVAGMTMLYDSELITQLVLGWEPQSHRNERFAWGTVTGYGAQRAVQSWMTDRQIGGASRLTPNSFGSGILTAGLVDALIGDSLAQGSVDREVIRGAAFFLPAVYRGVMGTRTLRLTANRPGVAAGGRVAARLATAGFVADMGVMGYRHLSEGEAQTTRDNRLYRRAGEIADVRQGWFSKLWRDALGIFMPSFAERSVPTEYVESAHREMNDHAEGLASGAAQVLRHHLIFGTGGEEQSVDFFRKVDWGILREENNLGVIKKEEGKSDWYLKVVADDLADPVIRYKYLEGKNAEQQIRFIQDRYRWNLSASDVKEILGRIALYHARKDLAQIHTFVTPRENAWANMFDESGKLKTGKERNLVIHLFASTGEIPTEEQILALRKVALLVRIRQLREVFKELESRSKDPWVDMGVYRAEAALRSYETVAKKIGVMDSDGEFAPGEITDQAMRMSVVQNILEENASGLL